MRTVTKLACGLLIIVILIVVFSLTCSKRRLQSARNSADSASDKSQSDAAAMTLEDMKKVLKEVGFPYADSITDAHFFFSYEHNLSIRMRLVLPIDAGSHHDELLQARPVECRRFRGHPFNISDAYSLPWWDPLPTRESDVCMKWPVEESKGDVSAICRSDPEQFVYYLAFAYRKHEDVDPAMVSFMRTGTPVKMPFSFIPARGEDYEFQYSSR